MRAQPQYRVTVTPVAMVANVTGDFNITLCFREANSPSAAFPSHCPLGMTTVPANTVFPDVTLELGDGSDDLLGPYLPGIGVFLRVEVVDSEVNGTSAPIANDTILQTPGDPGTDIEINMLPIEGGGVYSIRYRVDCIDGFIGVDCNESPATTSDAASGNPKIRSYLWECLIIVVICHCFNHIEGNLILIFYLSPQNAHVQWLQLFDLIA